jgi:hypothetical protein
VLEFPHFVNHSLIAIRAFLLRLRRGRPVRYSRDEEDAPDLISLSEVRDQLGPDIARLFATHFYYTDASGRPAIDRGTLVNLLGLLANRLRP